jgi:hypothetical protein
MTEVMMTFFRVSVGGLMVLLGAPLLEANAAEAPTNQPSREQLLEERQLTPEQRARRIREIRERLGTGSVWRAELERRREELKNLSPQERRAKMQEWRAQRAGGQVSGPNPENQEVYRRQIRERLQKQIQELNAKKAAGLSPEEQKRLGNLEQVSKYFGPSTSSTETK